MLVVTAVLTPQSQGTLVKGLVWSHRTVRAESPSNAPAWMLDIALS